MATPTMKFHACFYWMKREPDDADIMRAQVDRLLDGPPRVDLPDGDATFTADEFEWNESKKVFVGLISRERGTGLPPVRGASGLRPMDLADGESLSEISAFVYSPSLGAVAWLYNHHGPKIGRLRDLLARGMDDPVRCEEIMRDDVMNALREGPYISKLRAKIGQKSKRLDSEVASRAVRIVEDLQRELDGYTIEITVSSERGKKGKKLNLTSASAMISQLLRRDSTKVLVAHVPPEAGAKSEPLNLLGMAMKTEKFDVMLNGRHVDRAHMRRVLLSQWDTHRTAIVHMNAAKSND